MQKLSNYLKDMLELYPETKSLVNVFRQSKGKDLPDWPDWCFLPMAAFYSIVSNGQVATPKQVMDLPLLTALATWRYSKGIYKFHDEVIAALITSEITGDLPTKSLYQLPEWCLYVDLDNHELTYFDKKLNGFFVHLECDMQTGKHELRFVLDSELGLIPEIVHIGETMTLEQSFNSFYDTVKKNQFRYKISTLNDEIDQVISSKEHSINQLKQLISIVLYLCSEERDISNRQFPDAKPTNPIPKKVKGGNSFFPAEKIRYWDVGEKIGDEIERSRTEYTGLGASKRPHLRRAHWHGFWTGSSNNKVLTQKWIPPIFVAGNKNTEDEI